MLRTLIIFMAVAEMENFLTQNLEQRQLKKHISHPEKLEILNLWLRGKSCTEISRQTGRNSTTVCRWINRWKYEGHINRRFSPVRPPTCTYQPSHMEAPQMFQRKRIPPLFLY